MAYLNPRAKRACSRCHTRRIRCNASEMHPCSNCESCSATCEVLPSRRGRYPRKARKQRTVVALADALRTLNTTSTNDSNDVPSVRTVPPVRTASPSKSVSPRPIEPLQSSPVEHQCGIPTSSTESNPISTERSLFYGESNLLTLFPGPLHQEGDKTALNDTHANRLSFPISTPQDDNTNTILNKFSPIKAATERYLIEVEALTFPNLQSCLPALQAYFTWFHPCFPILDRADAASAILNGSISPLLFQAILFIAASYCDESTILAMGFNDRFEAKHLLYTRARVLFDADWEEDPVTSIQALILMSFWRGESSDIRNVRYWLGVAITLAQTHGLHRLTRFSTEDPKIARMRRRIWWSIYVRERQASASLGLPSRIRDVDCDVEYLAPSDLEEDSDHHLATSFGICKHEHIVYALKMIDIARLLGRIIDIHFVPGWKSSKKDDAQDLIIALEQWKQDLPDDMTMESEREQDSVWTCLLYLAYNHLRILIHRNGFLRNGEDQDKHITISAACQISRITENMLTQTTIQFGQMHLITSLFAALCIHAIDIRMANGVGKRLAEHRAKMCLLGLKEIQKFWKINNHVLDLFFQYLDKPIAKKLHESEAEGGKRDELYADQPSNVSNINVLRTKMSTVISQPSISPLQAEPNLLEDQHFDFLPMSFEVENAVGNFEQFFDPLLYINDPVQGEYLNFLERCL